MNIKKMVGVIIGGLMMLSTVISSGNFDDVGIKNPISITANAESQANSIYDVAYSQLGIKERTNGSDDILYNDWYYGRRVYNSKSGQYAWCAVFVSWCANQAGIPTSIIPKTAGTTDMKDKLINNCGGTPHVRGDGYRPVRGDIIFFGANAGTHVGIVDYSTDTTVYYIDGNNTQTSPHGVHYSSRTYSRTDVWGYVTPNYGGGVIPPPVPVDSRYSTPITAYPAATSGKIGVYNSSFVAYNQSTRYIDWNDQCTIQEVYTNGYCKVTYPTSNGSHTEFAKTSDFIPNGVTPYSYSPSKNVKSYRRSNLSNEFGEVYTSDKCTVVGISDNKLQLIYPLDSGGYKLAWITKPESSPTGYSLEITASSVYNCEQVGITITPYDDNITNYKLYIKDPSGNTKTYDRGDKNQAGFWPTQIGTYIIYGEVSNSYGSYKGSPNDGGLEVSVSKPDMGKAVDLGTDFEAFISTSYGTVLTNDSDNVSAKTKTSANNQKWRFIRKSNGSYEIVSVSGNGKRLDEYSGKGRQGDNVQVYNNEADDPQTWNLYSAGNNFYYVMPTSSESAVLDVQDANTKSGANIWIWPFHGGDSEKFKIEKIEKQYSVTFDANGGSVSSTSQTVTYNSKYGTLPTPSRTGYNFTGWFTAKTGGTQIKADTKVTITANQTLYAHWETKKFTITFDANGGTVSSTSQTVTYDSKYGTLPTPTRTGYSFTGWFTAKSDGTQIKADTKVAITANQTLYAHWTINKVNVHFNGNSGTIASGGDYYLGTDDYVYKSKDKKILDNYWEYNQKCENGLYNASTFKLTKTGYTFVGWSNGKKVFDQDDANVSANDLYPEITTKSGTITLYAKWDINKVNVHFNANGGTIASGGDYYVGTDSYVYTTKDKKILDSIWSYNQKYKDGLYNPETFNLTRAGYKFVGWSDGKTVFDQNDANVSANDLYPDITTKSGTITLYAKWEKLNVAGDCDNDGKLGVTDIIMLQKWILSTRNAKLTNAKAADLNGDGVVDVFDLGLLKRKLISKK